VGFLFILLFASHLCEDRGLGYYFLMSFLFHAGAYTGSLVEVIGLLLCVVRIIFHDYCYQNFYDYYYQNYYGLLVLL
jgi:hypothetical protein